MLTVRRVRVLYGIAATIAIVSAVATIMLVHRYGALTITALPSITVLALSAVAIDRLGGRIWSDENED